MNITDELLALAPRLRALDPMYATLPTPEGVDEEVWNEALARLQDAHYHFCKAMDLIGPGGRATTNVEV